MPAGSAPEAARDRRCAVGVALLALALYAATGPGRLDVSDGALRFEVAQSYVNEGRPAIRDPALFPFAAPGPNGVRYAYDGAARALTGVPLAWAGLRFGDRDGEAARFLFSLTQPIFGALCAGLFFLFARALGAGRRAALGQTTVLALCTGAWPAAASTFDQTQHAFFALLALWFAWTSARRESRALAALAGLAGGVLVAFQESYGFLLLGLSLAALEPAPAEGRRPAGLDRLLLLWGCAALVFLAWTRYSFAVNRPIVDKWATPYPVLRSPLPGLVSLAVSPGKGLLWFSPPMILAFAGLRRLGEAPERRWLGRAVWLGAGAHLLLVASLGFFGGDWCWGPRYLVPLLPLWALGLPFASWPARPAVRRALIAGGLAVQLLALSVDHNRFFMERNLHPMFWAYDPWCYWKGEGQLAARVGEARGLLARAAPAAAPFAPTLHPGSITHAVAGLGRAERWRTPQWMRGFAVFYLPRPWPLWMRALPPARRPIDPASLELLLLAAGGAGLLLALRNSREDRAPALPPGP